MTLRKILDEQDMEYLTKFDYPTPNDFFGTDPKGLKEIYEDVISDINNFGNKIGGLKRRKKLTEDGKKELDHYTSQHSFLSKYKNILELYFSTSHLKVGEGLGRGIMSYFSPQELIKRLELLNGSLAAGNNGVLPEYIQIAHRLRDLGVVTNNQLNTLLRKYIHF